MMVGRVIIGIVRQPSTGQTLLHVEDPTYKDRLSIWVQEQRCDTKEAVVIELGDHVWWQSSYAMWTPKHMLHTDSGVGCGKLWDIQLPRMSYAH